MDTTTISGVLSGGVRNPEHNQKSLKVETEDVGFLFCAEKRTNVRVSLSKDVQSRGLTTRQAAAFWGVHYHTFRKLVRLGVVPGPIKLPGLARPIFDRQQQEAAFDRFRNSEAV